MSDELLNYVKEQLAKGYKPANIKNSLIRQGYSSALVDSVIESVTKQGTFSPMNLEGSVSSRSTGKPLMPKLFLGIAMIAVITAGILLVPNVLKPKGALLDVIANPDKLTYSPGETLSFTLQIINMGSTERFDVTIKYRVLDSDNNIIAHREKTIAVSTSTSFHETIELPVNAKPGDYTLNVIATYPDNKIATSSFSFGVEKTAIIPVKPSCNDGIKNQDETGIDCGGICGGYWYDNKCHATPKETPINNTNTTTSSPQPSPSFARIMIDVSKLAKTSPEEAKNQCLEMQKTSERDLCLKTVAQSSNKVQYCDLIIDVTERDNCYIPFFMAGDYTLCERITDPQSKKSCETLREIQLIREAIGNTSEQTI